MNTGLLLRNIGRWLLLLALQIVVLDNVYLGGYANLVIYVLFILMLPTGMNKNLLLLLAFGSGLLVDVFNNMLGFHAVACTAVAFMRAVFADRMLTKDEPVVIDTPSIFSVGNQQYVGYLTLMLGVYNLLYFSFEVFDFGDLWRILLLSVLSTLADIVLVLLYQFVFLRGNERPNTKSSLS
ncbi:MAG: hypothetical protein MJZ51_07295 [Bacteroidales bacterium]|nr:hypothetical protein [Bacteroidales bacterium]